MLLHLLDTYFYAKFMLASPESDFQWKTEEKLISLLKSGFCLTLHTVKSSRTDATSRYRKLIDRYLEKYLEHSGYSRKSSRMRSRFSDMKAKEFGLRT